MEEVKKTETCKNCKYFKPDKGQFYIGSCECLNLSTKLCNDTCPFFEEKDAGRYRVVDGINAEKENELNIAPKTACTTIEKNVINLKKN